MKNLGQNLSIVNATINHAHNNSIQINKSYYVMNVINETFIFLEIVSSSVWFQEEDKAL